MSLNIWLKLQCSMTKCTIFVNKLGHQYYCHDIALLELADDNNIAARDHTNRSKEVLVWNAD